MKVEFTYEVKVTVDEEVGAGVKKALLVAAKTFDLTGASVEEIDACAIEDDE